MCSSLIYSMGLFQVFFKIVGRIITARFRGLDMSNEPSDSLYLENTECPLDGAPNLFFGKIN